MPKQSHKGLAMRLKEERMKKGYSQQQLALRASVSKRELGRIERGDAIPGFITIGKLAEALGITIAELSGEEGNHDLVATERKLNMLIEQCSWNEKRFILGLVQYVADNIKCLES